MPQGGVLLPQGGVRIIPPQQVSMLVGLRPATSRRRVPVWR